uniref:UPAR/Ly6 domain-containing protein n=1 Tax=Sinocyclocheilus anshuiensis TaxID=1608454 RepID=A0A671R187_9TELE
MFPAISPLDCLKFPQECPVGQRCIASTAVGVKGSMSIVLYERSCALPLQCDLSGQKHAAGINFNYTNECCDTDLCNTAAPITNLLYFLL